METVRSSGWSGYGKKMFTIVPFFDLTFTTNHVNAVLHTFGTVGRQRLAGYERFTSASRKSRGE